MLSLADRLAIMELIALHGHLVDDGRLDQLNRVFAEDVTHDLTAFGLGIHQGLGGVREAAEALGGANPVGHHVTNVVIVEVKDDNTVVTRSKGIGIRADGTAGSVVYDDIVTKCDGAWRIASRTITVRRKPLGCD
jgi:SnoaL-like protein